MNSRCFCNICELAFPRYGKMDQQPGRENAENWTVSFLDQTARELWGDGCHTGVVNVSLSVIMATDKQWADLHMLCGEIVMCWGWEQSLKKSGLQKPWGNPPRRQRSDYRNCQAGDRTLKTRDILESLLRQRQFNSGKLRETEFVMSDSSLEQLWLGNRDSGSYRCCIHNSCKRRPSLQLGNENEK